MDRSHGCSRPYSWAVVVPAVFLLSACGRDSSHTTGALSSDRAAPTAFVQYPPDWSLTDCSRVTLAIAASDETGVELVRAQGIPAIPGPDGLWRVSVPLSVGINSIRIETRDSFDNRDPHAAVVSIHRGSALWIEPSALAFDSALGDALVLDPVLRAVFRVSPSGARSVLTAPDTGGGVPLASPRDLDLFASHGEVAVTDGELDAVVLVDLTSGERRIVSSPSVGSGPVPIDLQGIAVDLLRARAFVLDAGRAELLAVDLVTGERSTISSGTRGTGPSLAAPLRISLDFERNRALVTLEGASLLLAVDLASGNRTVFSGGATGSGPAFATPFDLAVDRFQGRVLVTDVDARAILEVDLSTGARRIHSSREVGLGPDWSRPAGIALVLGSGALVIDPDLDALVEIVAGSRRIVSGVTTASGPSPQRPSALMGDREFPDRFTLADSAMLLAVRSADGERALVSGPGQGGGAPFVELSAVASFPGSRTTLAALDAGLPGLIEVMRFGGNRRILSGSSISQGPPLYRPRGLVLDGILMAAFVADRAPDEPAAILRIDLVGGIRSTLSDPTHGSGPDLADPVALESDARTLEPRAFVLDAALHAIFRVDLVTGDRERLLRLPILAGRPTDLAFDVVGNRFFVTVTDPSALLVVDASTQVTTVLSDVTHGMGPLLGRPVAIELLPRPFPDLSPGGSVAYVLDAQRGGLLAVDTLTGERVIRTK